MRPSPWPVLLPPSCPCCLPGRPLCPAAAGLRLLSSPSSLVLWLSLPASLPVCVLVCCLLPLFVWPLVVVVGFALVWCFRSALPVLMLVWWAVLVASLLR